MKPASPQLLSDFIQVSNRFLRSVNLEKDYLNGRQNGDYIVTATARQVLGRVSEGLKENSPYRAWTITGPYGVGKSAFAVFLTRLLCSEGDSAQAARRQLETADQGLAKQLVNAKVLRGNAKGLFPILVTGRRAATCLCLLQGISQAISQAKDRQILTISRKLNELLRASSPDATIDSAIAVSTLKEVNTAVIAAGYSGLLLLIDELGKLFEFAARSPHNADVYLLQQLAEFASRSGSEPVLIVGLLHQAFEDYGQHLDVVSRREWAKIQGRYEDIAFLEPAEQVIRMIASAICTKTQLPDDGLRRQIAATARLACDCGILPAGMKRADFEQAAIAAYPLHPTTLVALPFVFRRFAQNERSLFSYLSSQEPFGFQAFLKQATLNRQLPQFLRLQHLFDYFTHNFGLGLFRQPQARRWMEAADVIDRKDNLQDCHVTLIKSIGILNALGEFSPLAARDSVVSYSLADTVSPTPEIRTSLQSLRDQSILTYRKFNHTYQIWEGSDVDLDEKTAEGERKTRGVLGLSGMLARYLEPRPIVARRHSFESGALRFFTVSYVDGVEEMNATVAQKASSTGHIVVCLSSSSTEIHQFCEAATRIPPSRGNLIIAIPQDIGEIRSSASELAALRWVWDNTPELRDDRAARRELSLRIADSEQLLRAGVHRLLDPRRNPDGSECLWFHRGTRQNISTPPQVSQLLSVACKALYSKTPCIRNELIVRRALSSAAAAARRNLVEAMLTRASQPALGIEGFPPERSMYESVLFATGLHSRGASGEWGIVPPPASNCSNLKPTWDALCELVFIEQPAPQPVDQVFKTLAAPPFGVMEGLLPVLLCAFTIVHGDEVTLYREGTFLPEPGVADFELLIRRPELFAIAGSQVRGARAEVVARLAKGLKTKAATVPVVRALFRMIRGLPKYAWETKNVSTNLRALRVAFDQAKSPEKFLFVDLPSALDTIPFSGDTVDLEQVNNFFEALNKNLQILTHATPRLIESARDRLLTACGFSEGSENWQRLREAAFRIEPSTTHPALLPFLRRITQSQGDTAGISSVLALIAGSPPASWTDFEEDRFPSLVHPLASEFTKAMAALEQASSPAIPDDLSPAQRRQVDKLVGLFRKALTANSAIPDRQVQRAALLSLAQELQTTTTK